MASQVGDIDLDTPRDRAGTFIPRLVLKGSRRLGGLDDMIISLYAGGMTIRDIQYHLISTLGNDFSHETTSRITDEVLVAVQAWQSRPLVALYPVIYLDALVIKIRDGHHVINKTAHIGVDMDMDMDSIKHVPGIWIQENEGAKFWAGVCPEIANREVTDVLIVCCDGLSGFPEAIEATWPKATVQTCVVHLIRAAMRFVPYGDRKKISALLRPIYTPSDHRSCTNVLGAIQSLRAGRSLPGRDVTSDSDMGERVGALHPVPGGSRQHYSESSTQPTRLSR
jgi:putative transposase